MPLAIRRTPPCTNYRLHQFLLRKCVNASWGMVATVACVPQSLSHKLCSCLFDLSNHPLGFGQAGWVGWGVPLRKMPCLLQWQKMYYLLLQWLQAKNTLARSFLIFAAEVKLPLPKNIWHNLHKIPIRFGGMILISRAFPKIVHSKSSLHKVQPQGVCCGTWHKRYLDLKFSLPHCPRRCCWFRHHYLNRPR